MLYPTHNFNLIIYKEKQWVIRKNIEVEEKWALKREELEKRIKKNKNKLI